MLALFIVLLNLGFWQLRRLDARKAENNLYEGRSELAALQISDLLGDSSRNPDWEFRKVMLEGEYIELERESIVRNRTMLGRPGVWALTPFEANNGEIFIVNRGWIPRELSSTACRDEEGQEAEAAKPLSGRIQLEGILRLPTDSNRIDSSEKTDWQKCLPNVQLAGFLDLTEFPYWIQISDYRFVDPSQVEGEGPAFLESPDRGNGPHLSYAVQWFIFSAILAVGYPLILRRNYQKPPKKKA